MRFGVGLRMIAAVPVCGVILAPHDAAACRDPSNKVAAISVALETAKLGDDTGADKSRLGPSLRLSVVALKRLSQMPNDDADFR